jgi:hypothetical protein
VVKYTYHTCSTDIEVHALGALYTGALYYFNGQACVATQMPAFTPYEIGAAIPPTDLAMATLVVDP